MLMRSLKLGTERTIGEYEVNVHSKTESILPLNAFPVRFIGAKPIYIGAALYKTGAYFNHDCYPSVGRYFVGSTIVMRATHPMKVGDVVGENYGPIFTKKTLLERSRSLMSRYWFKCECRPCKENWQILDKLNNRARLKCVFVWGCICVFGIILFLQMYYTVM